MDKKQRTQIIITTGLIVVFVIAWANAFKAMRAQSKNKSPAQSTVPSAGVLETHIDEIQNQAPVVAQKKAADTDNYDTLEWKRCPFSGVILSDEASMADLRLNGIIWDEERPQVLINNEPYVTGEHVGRYTIVGIFKNKVVLSDGEKEFELLLF